MGHESRCTVKKGSEYLFSSGHSCGGSEDRVHAEGRPEEAEVGWLEEGGVSGDNKVVKEELDVRKQ